MDLASGSFLYSVEANTNIRKTSAPHTTPRAIMSEADGLLGCLLTIKDGIICHPLGCY
jgi:hypothetical protein